MEVTIPRDEVPPAAIPRVSLVRRTMRIDLRRFRYRGCHNLVDFLPVMLAARNPQGLKPASLLALGGPTEAAPYPKRFIRQRQLLHANYFSSCSVLTCSGEVCMT